MNRTYQYDAFISYRHLAPDKPIAERLQKLLETYIPPKHLKQDEKAVKLRLFRDETELPTSSDLGSDIEHALEQSRFLIVICSRNFSLSKWCMKELEYFKSLHNGNIDNILTVWVGEPDERPQFPDLLRFRENKLQNSDGMYSVEAEEIEPLAANVSAGSQKQAMKKLRTEFLRIAAPLLGCGYDDLFMREQRRRTRRKLATAFAIVGVLAVVALLSTTALFKIVSQNRELVKTNMERLMKESKALELGGDLYGALNSAVLAIPEKEGNTPILNDANVQTASLSGAFMPEVFTSIRSMTMSSNIDELYLQQNGTRVLALSENYSSLLNAETGEHILSFVGGCEKYNRKTACFFDRTIDSIELDTLYLAETVFDDSDYPYSQMQKHLQVNGKQSEDYFFHLNDENNMLEKVSMKDGSIMWSTSCGKAAFPFDKLLSDDVLPVVSDQEDGAVLLLFNAKSGDIVGQIGSDILKEFSNAKVFDAYYSNGYLLLFQQNNGGLSFQVYDISKNEYNYLNSFSIEAPAFSQTIKKDIMIYNNTLLISSIVYDYLNHNYISIFDGYDLLTGNQKWTYRTTGSNKGNPFTGCICRTGTTNETDTIGFAFLGNEIVAVNADAGDILFSRKMSFNVTDIYYSENGNVFFVDDKGREFCLQLQNLANDASENNYYMYIGFLHDFKVGIKHASFCDDKYAVLQQNANQIQIYTTLVNYNNNQLFHKNNLNDQSKLRSIISPDKSYMAVLEDSISSFRENIHESIVIIDLQKKSILYNLDFYNENINSYYFLGNDYLQVFSSDNTIEKTHLIDLFSGKEIDSFASEANHFILENAAKAELLYKGKNKCIYSIHPFHEPEIVVDAFNLINNGLSDNTDDAPDIIGFWVSPSGEQLALMIEKGSDQEADLYIYDRNRTLSIYCGTISAGNTWLSDCHMTCTWNEKDSNFYLLVGRTLYTFNYEKAKCVARWDETELSEVVYVEDSLCVIDITGHLYKAAIINDQVCIDESKSVTVPNYSEINNSSLSIESYSFLAYESYTNQKGILYFYCPYNMGNYNSAWLIDTDKFEIIYEIENFCGFDADKDIVYTNDGYSINSYPIYSPQELKAYANSILE